MSSICLGLNIQGMNPSKRSKSGWKLPKIRELIKDLNAKQQSVPFFAICETWLKPYITNTEIKIDNYEIFQRIIESYRHQKIYC